MIGAGTAGKINEEGIFTWKNGSSDVT